MYMYKYVNNIICLSESDSEETHWAESVAICLYKLLCETNSTRDSGSVLLSILEWIACIN